jgi:hypothetical protein
MRPNHVEASGMGQFLTALREREMLLNNPQRSRPMLYLKYWGSDYPYLQGREMQKRWLPVVVKSPSNI